jgi:hypothetical protein
VSHAKDLNDYQLYTEAMNAARNIDPEAGRGWRAERERLFAVARRHEKGAARYSEWLYAQFKASRGNPPKGRGRGRGRSRPSMAEKLAALKQGVELPVDAHALSYVQDPDTDERVVLELASAMHHAETDNVAVSWKAQERAAQFFNQHGLARALDEKFRLEAMPVCGGQGCSFCCVRCVDCNGFHPTGPRHCGRTE